MPSEEDSMLGKANGGGVVAVLNISCPNSSTITARNGTLSFTRTGTYASFKLPRTGTWTVTASYNGLSETRNIAVTPGQVVNVTMMSSFYLYNRGAYAAGFTSGWSAGDQNNSVYVESNSYNKNGSAISNGSVNLTGYRSVSVYINGSIESERYAASQLSVEITDAAGNVLLRQATEQTQGNVKTYDLTWTFNVSSINTSARFRLVSQSWSGGSNESATWGGIRLYSILLTA
jgi:hypothetical protein